MIFYSGTNTFTVSKVYSIEPYTVSLKPFARLIQ
jgi:hypothetical protein